MSDGLVTVEISSKLAAAIRDFQELGKAAASATKQITAVGTEAKTAKGAHTDFVREGHKVYDQTRTHSEKAQVELKRLNTLYRAGAIDADTLRRAVAQLGSESSASFTQAGTSVAGFALKLAGVGTAMAAATYAVRQLNRELEENKNRNDAAFGHAMSLVGAERALQRNIGVGGQMSPDDALAQLKGIASRTGASQLAVIQGGTAAFSARGRLSPQDAVNAVGAVAELDSSFNGSDFGQLSGAALDIRKAFGGSTEAALGMMMAGNQTARVENVGQYAQNIIPAVLGLRAYGLDAPEAFGLPSALTQITGDKTGAQAKTGSLTFARQIKEATRRAGFEGGFTQQLDFLQSPQGSKALKTLRGTLGNELSLAKAKLNRGEDLTGEAAMLPAFLEILNPKSQGYQDFQAAMQGMPRGEQAELLYEKTVTAGKSLTAARIGEGFRATKESLLSDSSRAQIGALRSGFEEIMTQSGGTFGAHRDLITKIMDAQIKSGATAPEVLEATIGQLESEQKRLSTPRYVSGQIQNFGGLGSVTVGRGSYEPPSATDQASAAAIGELVNELRGLRADLQNVKQFAPANGPRAALPGGNP